MRLSLNRGTFGARLPQQLALHPCSHLAPCVFWTTLPSCTSIPWPYRCLPNGLGVAQYPRRPPTIPPTGSSCSIQSPSTMLRPVPPTFGQVESGSLSLAICPCSKAQFHSTPLQIVSNRRSPRNARALGQQSRCTALHWVPSPHHNTDSFASGHKLSSFHDH